MIGNKIFIRFFCCSILGLMLFAVNQNAIAQANKNFSGLKNVDLRQCPGSNHDVVRNLNRELSGGGLPAWPGAGGMGNTPAIEQEPSIDRFTIIDDTELSLRAEITFSGLSSGKITAVILGLDGKKQDGLKEIPLIVDGKSGLLDLFCKLNPDVFPPNSIVNSGYVKLQFSPASGVGKEFCFILPKKWKALLPNESITVEVMAQPIKTALNLKNSETTLPVPGTAAPAKTETKPQTQETKSELAKAQAKSPSSATKPTKKPESDISNSSFITLACDGFNADVIANGVGLATASTTQAFDDDKQSGAGFYLLDNTYRWNDQDVAPKHALPESGSLSSKITDGLKFQLAKASGLNSLRINTSNTPKSLTFSKPQKAEKLFLLGAAGSGEAKMNISVNFADGSSELFTSQTFPDWFGPGAFAVKAVGRVNALNAQPSETDITPGLFQLLLNIDKENASKPITGITIYRTSNAGVINLMAATALPAKTNATSVKDSIDFAPQGPSSRTISLFDIVRSDVDFTSPSDLSPVLLSNIYYDKNPRSGVFYFLPVSYNLNWEASTGFNFKTLYTQSVAGADGNVNMSASLLAGISNTEIGFVKEYLTAYFKARPEEKFTEVNAILPNSPKISLNGSLQSLYNIGSDKISVSSSTSIFDPIMASWSSSTDMSNEILTALGKGVGITGDMSFKTNPSDATTFSVPVKIGLANEFSFGKINLKNTSFRTESFSNKFPYPIQLVNLHVLVFNESNGKFVPCVYSWSLGNKTVLSKSKIKLDASSIPAWIDNDPRVQKIWIEYQLQPCDACSEEVIAQVSSGTSSDRVKNIKISSMGVFKKYQFSFMKITIRSRFADPSGKMPKEITVNLTQDNSAIDAGPFYVWNEKDLSYEYKIDLLSDEKSYLGTGWIASKDYELYINRELLKKSLADDMPPAK